MQRKTIKELNERFDGLETQITDLFYEIGETGYYIDHLGYEDRLRMMDILKDKLLYISKKSIKKIQGFEWEQ